MEGQTIKTFTVDEANKLLPAVSSKLEDVFRLASKTKTLTSHMEDLVAIWGKDITDAANVDNAYYMEKHASREKAVKQINIIIEEINALGCVVKDAENGLVDFYHEKQNELIFLCWRYGERSVTNWHPVEGGFRTRQPI